MSIRVCLSVLTLSILIVSPNVMASKRQPSAVTVVTEVVEAHEINQSLSLIGKIKAAQSVVIEPEVAGKVKTIVIKANQNVEENQMLILLNDDKAQATLAEAKAYLKDEQRKLTEFNKLVKRNAITQTEIDAQQTSVAIAKARLNAAKADLADLQIRAPFAGTVGFVNFSKGKMVSIGTELLTLDNLSQMELDLHVPERYLSMLSVGMQVHATSSAWEGQDFIGEVIAIDTRINEETLNLRIRIQFDNPAQHLKPGMLMQAALVFPALKAPIIPVQALEYSGTKRYVYVIDNQNTAKRQEVFLGARVGNEVVIESGVEIGESIVVQGIVNMRDGVQVKEIVAPGKVSQNKTAAEQLGEGVH
ncbi:efflux transporter periplasmic adaptor subunit [Vibrio azureus]|uniref:Putative HlyD family secretion protein n=1 Tax=Vibrio azureus NBRC 104587 TaxID=1219077 RepID=U3ANG2_9VIBR|nr:efflux RND transporter periplasmic adaptor subunit [Vibrio azureus]AUI85715.1 efflux transporter periplasmic adaptor subunit [Vibrio azureus]GAD74817.1 putative HlyD family secretion protein [Vibrio azureus NBRC 104587]